MWVLFKGLYLTLPSPFDETLLPIQMDEEDIPFFAEVIAGGRITIPEEIRKIFGVKDGDHVMCRVRLVKKAEDVK